MNDFLDLSRHLCQLLQRPGGDAAHAPALRCALGGGRWIAWQFQAWQQRWLVAVGCTTSQFDDRHRDRLQEALLRTGHASRWGRQQAGAGDDQEIELVDCDFAAAPVQWTPAAVQERLQALWDQLDALEAGRSAMPPCGAAPDRGPAGARACGCAQAFSERMRALDASRRPGSCAAQELLLDGALPLRLGLHPRSHHWVLEAFVGDAAGLVEPLRRSLVAALLWLNGAMLAGRTLVCSLDGSDRVVVISRWHLDWAARMPVLDWLAYSLRQARRIRSMAAAMALQDVAMGGDAGSGS